MKTFWCAVAGVLSAAATLAALQLPAAWQNWKYSAAIAVEPAEASRLVTVVVPIWVSGHAQSDFGDLRVLDGAGREVPFILHARHERKSSTMYSARLLEISFKPGESTQAILDNGPEGLLHNSAVIEAEESEYFQYVEVAVSNDARDWRILRDRAPIFAFTKDKLTGNQRISYSDTRSRYLRVRVLDGSRRFALKGARLTREVVEEAERVPLEVMVRPDPKTPLQQTWFLADFGERRPAVAEARFKVDQPEFHRAVRIEAGDNADHMWPVGQGDIYRLERGAHRATVLRVQFAETHARYFRVQIFNRNDPPLGGLHVQLYGTPRRVVFRAEQGQTYRLLYGNTKAKQAAYEMAQITNVAALAEAAPASLLAEELNAAWIDPDPLPWSERHPYVLWVVLLIAVLVLGALAISTLRSTAKRVLP